MSEERTIKQANAYLRQQAEAVQKLVPGSEIVKYPKKMKVAVLWHADADGFGAAFAAHHALSEKCEMLFRPVQYGEPIPYKELREFAPDQVYILDFSYKAPDLAELMYEFAVVVIDHHKSAAEELKDFSEIRRAHPRLFLKEGELPVMQGVRVIQENSGCVLAWLYFNPNEPIPEILHYVQDRDLWKFELEHSKEINAYIATLPFDFQEWAEFFTPLAYDCGKAILAFQARQIEGRVKAVEMVPFWDCGNDSLEPGFRFTFPMCGYVAPIHIPTVNCSENISEVGEALCFAYPDAPFSMTYCDRPDGKRSYSLRSRNGFDVSEVAKAFGGGGHAGFTLASPPKI